MLTNVQKSRIPQWKRRWKSDQESTSGSGSPPKVITTTRGSPFAHACPRSSVMLSTEGQNNRQNDHMTSASLTEVINADATKQNSRHNEERRSSTQLILVIYETRHRTFTHFITAHAATLSANYNTAFCAAARLVSKIISHQRNIVLKVRLGINVLLPQHDFQKAFLHKHTCYSFKQVHLHGAWCRSSVSQQILHCFLLPSSCRNA